MAGQRQLKAAAQAGAVDGGDHRNRQPMDLRHNLLPLAGERFRFLSAGAAGNHIDISAGDKIVRFCGNQHDAAQRFIITNLANDRPHLLAKFGLQGIHLFTGRIDSDDADVIRANIEGKYRCHVHYSTSRIIAAPSPPAAQAVTRPNPPPLRRSSCSVWVIILAPVAAKGCP